MRPGVHHVGPVHNPSRHYPLPGRGNAGRKGWAESGRNHLDSVIHTDHPSHVEAEVALPPSSPVCLPGSDEGRCRTGPTLPRIIVDIDLPEPVPVTLVRVGLHIPSEGSPSPEVQANGMHCPSSRLRMRVRAS